MKTDKLLHLLQQKKFMRSGGALPLPKAQSGIPTNQYTRDYPPIYVTDPNDPRINYYAEAGNQYLYKRPAQFNMSKIPMRGMPQVDSRIEGALQLPLKDSYDFDPKGWGAGQGAYIKTDKKGNKRQITEGEFYQMKNPRMSLPMYNEFQVGGPIKYTDVANKYFNAYHEGFNEDDLVPIFQKEYGLDKETALQYARNIHQNSLARRDTQFLQNPLVQKTYNPIYPPSQGKYKLNNNLTPKQPITPDEYKHGGSAWLKATRQKHQDGGETDYYFNGSKNPNILQEGVPVVKGTGSNKYINYIDPELGEIDEAITEQSPLIDNVKTQLLNDLHHKFTKKAYSMPELQKPSGDPTRSRMFEYLYENPNLPSISERINKLLLTGQKYQIGGLIKAQTGIPSVAAANQQTIQNAGNPYLNRAMVQAVLAKANQPTVNTLGRVISTSASREQERREKVVANDPSKYSVMPGFQSDYNLGIQEPGADNSVLSDPIAMAAALTAGGVGLGAYGVSQIPRMFLGNLASEATSGLTDVGKYLTRNTALKNAYKEVPKQLPGSHNAQQAGFIDLKGAFQKYPKGPLTQEEIIAYKNSPQYKQVTEEHSNLVSKYGDNWQLPNYMEDALQQSIATGNRTRINPTLYGGRNWGATDYIIAGIAGTAYPGVAGLYGLAFSPPVVKNKVLNTAGITSTPGSLSNRDTTIDISNRPMDFAKVNETTDGQTIIGGEFIEDINNTVRKAKDWQTATDTYSDKEYPSKDIQSFYGVENGKFKVGKANEFNPNTEIVPRRFGETNISKAVMNDKEMRLLDKDGNPIYQNTPNTGKFILYSPSTKKAQFTYINTGKSGVDKINSFLNKNKDAQYIHLDNGRYEYYGVNPEGLTEQDFKNYYEQDLERKGNPGYNLIIKKNGGSAKNMVVSDLWKQVTGSDWSQAKKLGLTDGSYEQNIALREKLISSLNNQPAEKPQLNIPPKAKPRVAPPTQRVAINPMVQDASAVRPSNQQLAYEYYKTQPFGLTDPYSNVPLDQQYAMMQSATRQDQVYQTPTGLRAGTQGVLNQINQATNNDLAGVVSNFITYPVQAGVNIANTIAGDTPIRSDDDVMNLALDATSVLPYARGLKNLAGKGIRSAAYRGIEPFDYGIVDKTKNFFPNLVGNTLDPSRQLRNITEKYKSTGVSAKKAERLGKNMLDSWATGLGLPQKYNTLKKVGDDTYRIANSKIQADRLKNIWKEVNRYKRNSPNQQLITHASKDPKFSHSVYDFDSENALMGQYRWDVKKLSDGNIHFKSFDKYDLHPFGKRGAIFAKPESWVDEWRSKYFNKNLQDFEALGAIGGKPYNVENNFIFNPKTNKIVKRFNEGGSTYKVKIKKSK